MEELEKDIVRNKIEGHLTYNDKSNQGFLKWVPHDSGSQLNV
jgi:hypothetical protein